MSHKFVPALSIMALVIFCANVQAQEDDSDLTFRLLRDSATAASELELEDEEDSLWEPRITKGSMIWCANAVILLWCLYALWKLRRSGGDSRGFVAAIARESCTKGSETLSFANCEETRTTP